MTSVAKRKLPRNHPHNVAFTLSENNVTLSHPKLTRKLAITLPILHFWTQLQKGSIKCLLKTLKSSKLQINTSRSAALRPRAPPPLHPRPGRAPQQPPPARRPGSPRRGLGRAGGGARTSIAARGFAKKRAPKPSPLLKIGYQGVGLMMAPWFNLLQILSWKPPPQTHTHTHHTQKGGVDARRVEEGEQADVHIFGDNNIIRENRSREKEELFKTVKELVAFDLFFR